MQRAFVVSDLYATRNWYEHDTCSGIQKTSLFTIISGLYSFQVLFNHIYTVHLSILRFTSFRHDNKLYIWIKCIKYQIWNYDPIIYTTGKYTMREWTRKRSLQNTTIAKGSSTVEVFKMIILIFFNRSSSHWVFTIKLNQHLFWREMK